MPDFKPGDVAMVVMTQTADGRRNAGGPAVAIRDNTGSWACGAALGRHLRDRDVVDARPLVVLDPEDRDSFRPLMEALFRERYTYVDGATTNMIDLQAALRSLIAPPKPDEPRNKWSVVVDSAGDEWVRALDGSFIDGWMRGGSLPDGKWTSYDQIAAVRVLSEGVVQ